jgi:hypothetical protein
MFGRIGMAEIVVVVFIAVIAIVIMRIIRR